LKQSLEPGSKGENKKKHWRSIQNRGLERAMGFLGKKKNQKKEMSTPAPGIPAPRKAPKGRLASAGPGAGANSRNGMVTGSQRPGEE